MRSWSSFVKLESPASVLIQFLPIMKVRSENLIALLLTQINCKLYKSDYMHIYFCILNKQLCSRITLCS